MICMIAQIQLSVYIVCIYVFLVKSPDISSALVVNFLQIIFSMFSS